MTEEGTHVLDEIDLSPEESLNRQIAAQTRLRERAVKQPPGLVVLPTGDAPRYYEFIIDFMNLNALGMPPGSAISMNRSGSVVENLNSSLSGMEPHHEWAWIMGDDHRFPADMLLSLLERDVDIVVPLGVRRTPPFILGQFKEEAEFFDERLGRTYPGYLPLRLDDVPKEGLFEVVATGSAGMLVRRPVIDAIGFPYFASSDGVFLNEDLEFCRRARALGFKIFCDSDQFLGHIGQMTLWPSKHEGRAEIRIDMGGPPGHNEVVIGRAGATATEATGL